MTSTWCYNASACIVFLLLSSGHLAHFEVLKESEKMPIFEQMTPPIASLPQGTIQGVNMISYRNRTFYGFKRIPFAKPPVGNLRFKGPVPPDAWNGTIDGSRESPPCTQLDSLTNGNVTGSEDCLYLNIYTPRLPASNHTKFMPVIMYIFGGRFVKGDNSVIQGSPSFILNKDVILVVPNYRLGLLGFLSTGDEILPGNYGLKDVVQALKWIQVNIQYFGGDSNKVTLFGSSSGAAMVHLLTLSNLTNGLFHRYITQSGTAFAPSALVPKSVSLNRANRLGQYFGCPTNSSTLLFDCLNSLNASQLVSTAKIFHEWGSHSGIVWSPSVEPHIDEALLTDSPANLFAAGKIRDLPWIALVTRNEGLHITVPYYRKPKILRQLLDNIDAALPVIIQYKYLVENVTAFTTALRSYYLNDLTVNSSLLLTNITQLIGDAIFTYPTYRAIKQQLLHAKTRPYFCSFEYRGRFSYTYDGGPAVTYGVSHADNLVYLIPRSKISLGPKNWDYNDTDLKMVDTMVQLWTSFARTGIPTASDSDNGNFWTPFTSHSNYLRIGNESDVTLEMRYDYLKERMQFWDELTAATSWKQ